MSFSDYLARLESVDGEVQVFQHNQTGVFYAFSDALDGDTLQYDAGENNIESVDISGVDRDQLVRVEEVEPDT